MANKANQNPLVLDTDFASFAAIGLNGALPLRVRRIALVAVSVTNAGTVAVTDKLSGAPLLSPTSVNAAQAASTILYVDEFGGISQTWPDFAVTGLTATGTALYVWCE